VLFDSLHNSLRDAVCKDAGSDISADINCFKKFELEIRTTRNTQGQNLKAFQSVHVCMEKSRPSCQRQSRSVGVKNFGAALFSNI